MTKWDQRQICCHQSNYCSYSCWYTLRLEVNIFIKIKQLATLFDQACISKCIKLKWQIGKLVSHYHLDTHFPQEIQTRGLHRTITHRS